jgi:hypothetical protein
MTCGYRVFVCSNMAFAGDFTPVLAKHSKSFSLIDCISVGVDRMQRNFEPMRKQVEAWQKSELTDVTAKVVIYEAFVEGRLEAPKHLARTVHDLYFEPKYEKFQPRTIWSLSNAFTSAFKELEPIPQFKATAKLSEFLEGRFSQSFWFVGRCRHALSHPMDRSFSVVILCFRGPFAVRIVLVQEIERCLRELTALDISASETGSTYS